MRDRLFYTAYAIAATFFFVYLMPILFTGVHQSRPPAPPSVTILSLSDSGAIPEPARLATAVAKQHFARLAVTCIIIVTLAFSRASFVSANISHGIHATALSLALLSFLFNFAAILTLMVTI